MSAENIKKPYRSCYYMESGISFLIHGISFCCDRPAPATVQPMADASKTVDALLEARDWVIQENQKAAPPCEGCNLFQEYEPANGKIKWINFGVHRFCQFSCTYCILQQVNTQGKNKPEPYDSLEIAEELKRRGLLSKSLEVICGPGEIAVHPKRDEYYDFLERCANSVAFYSNAGKFDPRLAHILSLSPRHSLTVSLDCGTEETFRKIRGVDMFQQVVTNLAEYRKYSPNICLKYILLDENCGDEDLNGFIRICSELKPFQIIIAGDNGKAWDWGGNQLNGLNIPLREEYIVNAAVKLAEGAIKSNIDFTFFDNVGRANLWEIRRRLALPEVASDQDNIERANLQKICRQLAAKPEIVSAEQQLDTILSASKVVCYGAGVNCMNILGQVNALGLRKPDVIWDIKAEDNQKFCVAGSEYPVRCPDFERLDGSTEIGMFITITNSAINQDLAQNMKEHGFFNLLTHDQLVLALMAKRAKMLI